jgi:hypothetical protein
MNQSVIAVLIPILCFYALSLVGLTRRLVGGPSGRLPGLLNRLIPQPTDLALAAVILDTAQVATTFATFYPVGSGSPVSTGSRVTILVAFLIWIIHIQVLAFVQRRPAEGETRESTPLYAAFGLVALFTNGMTLLRLVG